MQQNLFGAKDGLDRMLVDGKKRRRKSDEQKERGVLCATKIIHFQSALGLAICSPLGKE